MMYFRNCVCLFCVSDAAVHADSCWGRLKTSRRRGRFSHQLVIESSAVPTIDLVTSNIVLVLMISTRTTVVIYVSLGLI